jgi:hypothetical protein
MNPLSLTAWPQAGQAAPARIIVIDMHTFVKGTAGYSRQDIVAQLNRYALAGDKILFSMRDREEVQEEVMRRLIGDGSSLGLEGRFVFSREELAQNFAPFAIYMDDRENRWGAPCVQYIPSNGEEHWKTLDQALKGLKAAPGTGMAPAI